MTKNSESDEKDALKVELYDLCEAQGEIIKHIDELTTSIDETAGILTITGDSQSSEVVVLRNELHKVLKKNAELRRQIEEGKISYQHKLAELRGNHAQELNDIRSESTCCTCCTSSESTKSTTTQANGAALLTSPNTPSSVNTIAYNMKKRYYQAKNAECEENGGFKPHPEDPSRCINCYRRHNPDARIGAPPGHPGHQVKWKPDEYIYVRLKECKCGNKKIRKMGTVCKTCIDLVGNTMELKVTQFLLEEKYCSKCNLIIRAPEPGIPGTFIGKKLASFIVFSAGDSDRYSRIIDNVQFFTEKELSENTLRRCVQAVVESSLQSSMSEIMEELKRAPYVQIDETPFPVNGKRGYVWLVRTDKATFVVATTTRSAEVIPTFFGPLIGKYATADGYAAYPKFMKVQRCWSHELLQAERLAIKGGAGSLHDKLFDEMRGIYYTALVLAIKGGATDKQIDQLKGDMRVLIAKYGDHPIAGRFNRALDGLFVALSVPGMRLHNNHAETDIRKVVIYRNQHHQFKTSLGRKVFSILHSFVNTARKNGIFPADAILGKLNDPAWSLFGNSDSKPVPSKPKYYPPTDTQRAIIERYDAKVELRKARNNTTTEQKTQVATKPAAQATPETLAIISMSKFTPMATKSTAQATVAIERENRTVSEKQDQYYPPTHIGNDAIACKLALRSCGMALVLTCILMSVLGGTYLVLAMTATASIKFQYKWHVQTTCPSQPPWPPPHHTEPTHTQTYLHQEMSEMLRKGSGSPYKNAQIIAVQPHWERKTEWV